MKKVGKMLPIVAGILISSSAVALELPKNVTTSPDLLTGDVRLACEAILCLSSNQRPPECDPSIQRYYSIKHKKWQDTLRARQNFLKLCPVGEDAEKDGKFTDLRDNVLVNLRDDCTAKALNSRIETKHDFGDTYYRIDPKLPASCKALIAHEYTNLTSRKYVCSDEFYAKKDWDNRYKTEQIQYKEYMDLKAKDGGSVWQEVHSQGDNGGSIVKYFKKVPINKDCWVN